MTGNFKIIRFILLAAVAVFFFIFPWTKEIKNFRAKDVTWNILKSAKKINKFNTKTFTFLPKFQLNEEILELNGKEIRIKGFFKKEIHDKHPDFILTETVTDVCFMCNHDEQYNFMELIVEPDEKQFFDSLKDDTMIYVSGIFKINQKSNNYPIFLLKNTHLERK